MYSLATVRTLFLALWSELCSIGTGVTEKVTKTFPLLSWIVFSGICWSSGTYGGIMRWLYLGVVVIILCGDIWFLYSTSLEE